jgi:hypothetical protein
MLLRDKMDVMMQELENELDESWERVDAEKLGLDSRADCSRMWASDEGIATAGSTRSLEYYGGFEYIDKYCVTRMGDITLWSAAAERVRECLARVLSEASVRRLSAEYGDDAYTV